MRSYDLTPLFRHSIGFERMSRLLDTAASVQEKSWPPYNITKTAENRYQITLAVAGFADENIEIVLHQNVLTITGKNASDPKENVTFLHRGIAGRSFERRFTLADHIDVVDAHSEHGLLHISLRKEVPEALKPRTIGISSGRAVAAK